MKRAMDLPFPLDTADMPRDGTTERPGLAPELIEDLYMSLTKAIQNRYGVLRPLKRPEESLQWQKH